MYRLEFIMARLVEAADPKEFVASQVFRHIVSGVLWFLHSAAELMQQL